MTDCFIQCDCDACLNRGGSYMPPPQPDVWVPRPLADSLLLDRKNEREQIERRKAGTPAKPWSLSR